MTKLQKAIKQLCEAHGGLRKTARATGIDPAYLSRLRSGKKANPNPAILKLLGLEKRISYCMTKDETS